MNRLVLLVVLAVGSPGYPRDLDLGSTREITAARMVVLHEAEAPAGVLVFVAGFGVDGSGLRSDERWREACRRRQWSWVAVNFSSTLEDAHAFIGFTDARRGAGTMLRTGLERAGLSGLPLYLVGYSSGAQFVWSFVPGSPEVRAWCVYAASTFPAVESSAFRAPGLIACGTNDGSRFDAMYARFQELREHGAPVAWLPLAGLGHERPEQAEAFVLQFLASVAAAARPVWVHNISRRSSEGEVVPDERRFYSCLPVTAVAEWRAVAAEW